VDEIRPNRDSFANWPRQYVHASASFERNTTLGDNFAFKKPIIQPSTYRCVHNQCPHHQKEIELKLQPQPSFTHACFTEPDPNLLSTQIPTLTKNTVIFTKGIVPTNDPIMSERSYSYQFRAGMQVQSGVLWDGAGFNLKFDKHKLRSRAVQYAIHLT
jgi:hypothetical protein